MDLGHRLRTRPRRGPGTYAIVVALSGASTGLRHPFEAHGGEAAGGGSQAALRDHGVWLIRSWRPVAQTREVADERWCAIAKRVEARAIDLIGSPPTIASCHSS
jgi:hypothetical protein